MCIYPSISVVLLLGILVCFVCSNTANINNKYLHYDYTNIRFQNEYII